MLEVSQFEENKKKGFAKKLKTLVEKWEEANGETLTQGRLAPHVHASRETVNSWFTGRNYPSQAAIDDLCSFFSVPPEYFNQTAIEDMILLDENLHRQLSGECEENARRIGLDSSLVQFLKNVPAIADSIVSVSWVDALLQPDDPDIPDNPDGSPFQFSSSTGVKIYLPPEVLYMLRVVQRDLTEYAAFLVQKWGKVIQTAHKESFGTEWAEGRYTTRAKSGKGYTGKEYVSASQRFALELKGRGSLTPGASLIVDMYNGMNGQEQEKLISETQNAFHESRKKNPQAQKVRQAVREAMKTNKPVPPLAEILKDDPPET